MFRINMQDLEHAKLRLKEKDLSLVVVRNRKIIFETEFHGIKGFLEATELLGKELAGSSVADKVVGRAVAFLSVYFQISAVFAVVMSGEGARVLEDNNIFYQFEKYVPNILNPRRNDICPFEKLALTFTTPEDAYKKLRACVDWRQGDKTVSNQ
jgi:hypothetical protein